MRRIVLVTGGARSGKSAYALKLGEAAPGPRAFIATAEGFDEELRARIRRHRRARGRHRWKTVEEPDDLPGALKKCARRPVVLMDCLALWVNNLQYRAERARRVLSEGRVARETRRLLAASHAQRGTLILVTNEAGLGIVPENAAARLYRDLLGRCNQTVAAAAQEVVFMVSGQPLHLKEKKS